MNKRLTKSGETRTDSYGRGVVIDEEAGNLKPEEKLWVKVIWQAILNVNNRIHGYEEDLLFLTGGKNWVMVCDWLNIEPKQASIKALMVAFGPKLKFAKR